jgi:hypothetical protein
MRLFTAAACVPAWLKHSPSLEEDFLRMMQWRPIADVATSSKMVSASNAQPRCP